MIVPVYNNEPFLKECLDSLINQTLKELEIICVDDGSTDNSLKVLREYEKKYDCIKVFSQENSGAGIARNHGLKYVQGEYVSFIDSDDWLELDAFEKLYTNAKSNDSDLVFFNAIEHYPDRNRKRIYFPNNEEYAKRVFNYHDNKKIVMNGFLIVCTKLHRTRFIKEHNIQFKDFPVNNDVSVHIETTLLAERISYVPDILYHYRRDEPISLQTSTVKTKKGFASINLFKSVEKFLKEHELMGEFETNFLNFKFGESEVRLNQLDIQYKDEFLQLLKNDYNNMEISFNTLKKIHFRKYKFYIHVLNAKNYDEFDTIHNFGDSNFTRNVKKTTDTLELKSLNTKLKDLKIENQVLSDFYNDCMKNDSIIKAINLINHYNLFDSDFYRNTYNYKLNIDPLLHYIYKGYDENKNPSEIFDGEFYLNFNKNAKNSNLNPLVYFVLHGIDEGKIKINKNLHQPQAINKKILREKVENFNELGINKELRNERIIVSLTSFPERMYDLKYCLYSLLNQTLKPDEIVLWLTNEEFPNKEKDIPKDILKLKSNGLSIKWAENMRSYTKLIPSLKEYPNDIIITVDDDIFYNEDLIENLYHDHLNYPNDIICARSRKIEIENGEFADYSKWNITNEQQDSSYLNFLTGVGGVLYPISSFNDLVLNYDLAKELCPSADDIWFWGMAILNYTKIRVIENCTPVLTCVNPAREMNLLNEKTLWSSNASGGNDVQLVKFLEHYPMIVDIALDGFSKNVENK